LCYALTIPPFTFPPDFSPWTEFKIPLSVGALLALPQRTLVPHYGPLSRYLWEYLPQPSKPAPLFYPGPSSPQKTPGVYQGFRSVRNSQPVCVTKFYLLVSVSLVGLKTVLLLNLLARCEADASCNRSNSRHRRPPQGCLLLLSALGTPFLSRFRSCYHLGPHVSCPVYFCDSTSSSLDGIILPGFSSLLCSFCFLLLSALSFSK